MATLLNDIRYAVRSLIKQPGLLAVAIITLALGIGANTAIFSVVNAVLLRPLPYNDPERLVIVWETMGGNDRRSVAPGNYVDWRDNNRSFSAMAATFNGNFNLTGDGEPERVDGATITSNLMMDVLGVSAQLGRTFQPDDDAHQDRLVVLISDGLWKRRFGSEPKIIGSSITVDEAQYTIVGVMPGDFRYPVKSDLWILGRNRNAVSPSLVAQFPDNDWNLERDAHFLSVVGRLKPGATLSQAQSDMAAIARRAEEGFPKTNAGLGSNVVPLHTQVVGKVQGLLFILLGAVAFVLLIACTNVANLLLARAVKREREMAIRVAVGASRWHVMRQLLTESLLLSLAGGVAGLVLSAWVVDLFVRLSPGNIPRLEEASVDLRLLGFTFAVSLLTGIGFGLLPALHATRVKLNSSLKEGDGKTTAGRLRQRTRNILIASEIALAQVLLVGAGLLIMTYVKTSEIDPGFNPEGVLTAKIAPSAKKYPNPKAKAEFYAVVLDHLGKLPGVQSVGMVMNLPLSGSSMNRGFRVEGRPDPKPDENITMDYQVVNEDYFRTFETPVLRGRGFTKADTETSERVIVINQAMARRYWPNEEPVGRRMAIGESTKDTSWRTIIGVVGDMRHASLIEAPVPTAFTSYRQDVESWPRMAFVIKAEGDPSPLVTAVRRALVSVDPSQPVYAVQPMDKLLADAIAPGRFVMFLIGALAFVALALAAVGVYGVISFSVGERTHEMGIRIALGAGKTDVLALVLGQCTRIAALGIAVGLLAALALTRLMSGLLFGVSPTDPITFAAVSILLGAIALFACYIPARRATKVDPVVALRHE